MKKIVFSVIAACSLFALFGCNHRAETDTVQPAAMEELKPMQQSWRGVLPCADCEGIDTSLFWKRRDRVMNEHYRAPVVSRHPLPRTARARTADKLVLTNSKGEILLSRERRQAGDARPQRKPHSVSSQLYPEPVKASLPTTPMAMRGMYFYMADAATLPIVRPVNASRWRTMPSLNGIMPPRADRYSPGTAGGRRALYSRDDDDGGCRQIYSR